MTVHDVANHDTCECGQPGCGSYRPLPGGKTMRELISDAPDLTDSVADELTHRNIIGEMIERN